MIINIITRIILKIISNHIVSNYQNNVHQIETNGPVEMLVTRMQEAIHRLYGLADGNGGADGNDHT